MNSLRRISKGIAAFLLLIILLVAPLVISLQMVINSPEVVKKSLDQSNLYETSSKADLLQGRGRLSSVVVSDPGIISAFNNAITPSYVKTSSEKLIDNVYAYVQGVAPSAELSTDVLDVKTRFADNVADYVKQKFDALPRCTELMIPSTTIESLLQATCAPIGVSSSQASEYARSQIMNTALFSNDRLELAGLVGMRESLLNSYLTDVRNVYPYFILLVYILPVAGIILTVGLLFLNNAKRRGVKTIANLLLSAGLINILAAFIITGILGFIIGDSVPGGSRVAESLGGVGANLLDSLRTWWLGCAGLFAAVSIIVYIILGVTGRPHSSTRIS